MGRPKMKPWTSCVLVHPCHPIRPGLMREGSMSARTFAQSSDTEKCRVIHPSRGLPGAGDDRPNSAGKFRQPRVPVYMAAPELVTEAESLGFPVVFPQPPLGLWTLPRFYLLDSA